MRRQVEVKAHQSHRKVRYMWWGTIHVAGDGGWSGIEGRASRRDAVGKLQSESIEVGPKFEAGRGLRPEESRWRAGNAAQCEFSG